MTEHDINRLIDLTKLLKDCNITETNEGLDTYFCPNITLTKLEDEGIIDEYFSLREQHRLMCCSIFHEDQCNICKRS